MDAPRCAAPPCGTRSQSIATPVLCYEYPMAQRQWQDSADASAPSAQQQQQQQQQARGGATSSGINGPRAQLTCQERLDGGSYPPAGAAVAATPRPLRPAQPALHAPYAGVPRRMLAGENGAPLHPCPPGVYTLGTPLPKPQAQLKAEGGAGVAQAAGLRTPRASILSAPIAIPPPPMFVLSPRMVASMRPHAILKLAPGAVRISGNAVTPVPPPPAPITAPAAAPLVTPRKSRVLPPSPSVPTPVLRPPVPPALARVKPLAAPSISAQSSANRPPPRRELSFADLPNAAAACGRGALQPAPLAGGGGGVLSEMCLSPRKRARKSTAPARAGTAEEPAGAGGAGLGGGLRRQGSFQAESEGELLQLLVTRKTARFN